MEKLSGKYEERLHTLIKIKEEIKDRKSYKPNSDF